MIFTAAALVLAIAVALWARRPLMKERTTPVDFEEVGTAVLQARQYARVMVLLLFAILFMLGVMADRISMASTIARW
jgi:hypothetical protein